MIAVKKRSFDLYVDHSTGKWVVRDTEGSFWIVPTGDDGWDRREALQPTEKTELEPIPAHYMYLLRLPF
jgi:hypothetical protein